MVLKEIIPSTVMRKILLITLLTVSVTLLTSTAAPAFALNNPFQQGDVFAGIANGQIQRWSSAGVLQETITCPGGGFTTGMAFDANGNLYVTMFTNNNICKVLKADSSSAIWATSSAGNLNPESILFTGPDVYVGHAGAFVIGNQDIDRFDLSGTLQQSYNVAVGPRGSDWIDLATDGQTMFYTSEGSLVKRFDVSGGGAQLADFSNALTGPGAAFAFRLLPGGGLIASDSTDIKRLDAAGNQIFTYDFAGQNAWFSFNLDPDGTSFWAGDSFTGEIHKFDIGTGNHLQTINTGVGVGAVQFFGVTVFGEITVSNPIGGEILPISTTSLLLAGMSSNAMWLIPLVAIGGGAFALLRFQVLKGKN